MPESRQQLIGASSFLQRERENFGGMRFKRSTITGSSFKKGTSQESSRSIEDRVSNNERKITLLKNIILTPKGGGLGDWLRGKDSKKDDTYVGQVIVDIRDAVGGILRTLVLSDKKDEKIEEKERISKEQEERDEEEEDLEKDKWKTIKDSANKVLAPVKTLWQKVFGFLTTIFFGRFFVKLFDWFSSKKNQKKVKSVIKFIETWWPAIITSVLLFGTGFGTAIAALGKLLVTAIPTLIGISKGLIAYVSKNPLKALGTAALVGGGAWALSKVGSEAGDTEFAGGGFVVNINGGVEPQQKFAEGGRVPGSGNKDTVSAKLTPGEFVISKSAVQKWGVDTFALMNAAGGGTNLPTLGGGGGGTNSLTEQAKVKTLTSALLDFFSGDDGRSRRMTDLERSQRMAGGGLVQHFSNGGLVTVNPGEIQSYQDLLKHGVEILDDSVPGMSKEVIFKYRVKQPKRLFQRQKYKEITFRKMEMSKEAAQLSLEDFINQYMAELGEWPKQPLTTKKEEKNNEVPISHEKDTGPTKLIQQPDGSFKRVALKNLVTDEKDTGPTRLIQMVDGSVQRVSIPSKVEIAPGPNEKNGSDLKPPPPKEHVLSPEEIIALQGGNVQDKSGEKKEVISPGSPEIPDFAAGIMRSPSKIKTLGILAL